MKKIIFLLITVTMIVIMAFSPKNKHTVSGVITDETNTPVAMASVIIKGTRTATTSDQNGKYSIKVGDDDATLVITKIGYTKQEVMLNNRTIINIKLVMRTGC